MKSFETFEHKKLEREKSQNDLESFVLDTRDKLDQQLYQSVTTADEREKILEKLKEASEWLEEQGIETETKVNEFGQIFCSSFVVNGWFF